MKWGILVKQSLFDLKLGENARVLKIHLDEQSKLRLLNFGVYEGEKIRCVMSGPFQDPKAYLVKGTMFALRNVDALQIEVEKDE